MQRATVIATLIAGLLLGTAVTQAAAGPVRVQFGGGAFGLPWSAGKSSIEAKYPGGKWDTDDQGRDRYCATSRQTLLKLAPQYQTRELCFLIGSDGTLTGYGGGVWRKEWLLEHERAMAGTALFGGHTQS